MTEATARGIPTNFDTGSDGTLDGRTPIAAGPEVGGAAAAAPVTMSEADIAARVDREAAARVEQVSGQHAEALSRASENGARAAALTTLQAMIAGNPGETLAASQFRGQIQDIVLSIHGGSDTPVAEHLAEAMRLNESRIQGIAADGGDGSEQRPEVMDRAPEGGSPRFSMPRFLSALGGEITRLGDGFDPEAMTGSPDVEFARGLLDNPRTRAQFAAIQGDLGPRGRAIPFPIAALNDLPTQFAETYGTGPDTRREPTYRRDALVGFQRPSNVLGVLGVPMPTTDNDFTMPRLSASIEAAWLAENAASSDDDLTVAVFTTVPHRLTTRSTLSWMLLAAGDAQFGHQALILDEMSRAVMSAREAAVYNGASSGNDPTGIRNFSGVTTTDVGTTAPTYADLLSALKRITDHNIDVAEARWAINWTMATILWQIRRFSTGSSTLLEQAGFSAPGMGPADDGMYGAIAGRMPGGKVAAVTNHLPVATSGDTDMICGVWRYVWCIDYSTMFLTIDDISEAANGRTKITTNSYHEVAPRWADAFEIVRHDSIT